MKKIIIFIIAAAMLVSLAACSNAGVNTSSSGVDRTVDVESFDINGMSVAVTGSSSADFLKTYPDAASLCADADVIIVGTVQNVKYTDTNAEARIYYDFLVGESWEGEMGNGDIVTIVQSGGYVRGDVFRQVHGDKGDQRLTKNDLIKETAFGAPFPQQGDKYVLFLREMFDGTYSPLNNYMGKYTISGKTVERYEPDTESYISNSISRSDPNSLNGLRDTVYLTLKNYVAPPAPNFATIKETYINNYGVTEKSELMSFYDEMINTVQVTAANSTTHPVMLFLGTFTPLHVAGGETFQSYLMETAGGINAAKDTIGKGNFTKVTMEEIEKWDPEIIYVPCYAVYSISDILNDPAWQEIRAVRNGNVIAFPGMCEPWDLPTPATNNISVCLGLGFISNSIYPEQYSHDQLLIDANKFYELQGYSFTAEYLGLA